MYKIGSVALGLSNNHDVDELTIVKENDKYYRQRVDDIDMVYISENILKEIMTFNPSVKEYEKLCMYAYQLDKKIQKNVFPIDYNILDYREQLISYLKICIENKKFNFSKYITRGENHCCSKMIYHYAYNYFILRNNSSKISAQQRKIIQQIHDEKMPIAFLAELKTNIYNLK